MSTWPEYLILCRVPQREEDCLFSHDSHKIRAETKTINFYFCATLLSNEMFIFRLKSRIKFTRQRRTFHSEWNFLLLLYIHFFIFIIFVFHIIFIVIIVEMLKSIKRKRKILDVCRFLWGACISHHVGVLTI